MPVSPAPAANRATESIQNVLDEQGNDLVPRVPALRKSVQQDHERCRLVGIAAHDAVLRDLVLDLYALESVLVLQNDKIHFLRELFRV